MNDTDLERPTLWPDLRRSGPALLVAMLATMWLVEILDTVALADRLQRSGIHPRRLDGLIGILWAPFLHGGFAHLVANSVPLLVLGGLVLAHGRARWLVASAIVIAVGGALTWLLGRAGNHVGASGLVFGYFGYLVGSAVIRRNATSIITAVVALVFYGGLVIGFVPRSGVSWEGHLFGAAAGVIAAKLLSPPAGGATEIRRLPSSLAE